MWGFDVDKLLSKVCVFLKRLFTRHIHLLFAQPCHQRDRSDFIPEIASIYLTDLQPVQSIFSQTCVGPGFCYQSASFRP